MNPPCPTTKNPPDQFAGDVWLDPIALPHDPTSAWSSRTVRFAPGARTAWHSHEHGQYLRVTQGVAVSAAATAPSSKSTPARRSTPRPARSTGTPPRPGIFMEHIAMLQNGDDPAKTTTWVEHITDDEYNGTLTFRLTSPAPSASRRAMSKACGLAAKIWAIDRRRLPFFTPATGAA